jgi:hypothetical protein
MDGIFWMNEDMAVLTLEKFCEAALNRAVFST